MGRIEITYSLLLSLALALLSADAQVATGGAQVAPGQGKVRRFPPKPAVSEEEEVARENARTHVIKESRIPSRREAVEAMAEGKTGRAKIEAVLNDAKKKESEKATNPGWGGNDKGPGKGDEKGQGNGPGWGNDKGPGKGDEKGQGNGPGWGNDKGPGWGQSDVPGQKGKGDDDYHDDVLRGRKTSDGETVGSSFGKAEMNWVNGYVVDGLNPDVYVNNNRYALRLRTTSVVINPGYTLRDMASRNVLRLKGDVAERLLRISINAPPPKRGDADPYLITLGMATGWNKPTSAPVAIFLDEKGQDYEITKYGIQLVKQLTPGPHLLEVYVEPGFEGDIFEFHYAMVNRL